MNHQQTPSDSVRSPVIAGVPTSGLSRAVFDSMKTYSEKLKDPRWQRKRLEIMQRDGFRCRRCGSGSKTLNVHHWKYDRNPWDAKNSDLVTFCEECHQNIEKRISVIKHHLRYEDVLECFEKVLCFVKQGAENDHMMTTITSYKEHHSATSLAFISTKKTPGINWRFASELLGSVSEEIKNKSD